MILAGDIGGTKTVLGLFDPNRGSRDPVREEVFPSRNFGSLEQILERFLGTTPPKIQAAAFGVAGAILDGHCLTTNLAWEMDERELATALGTPRCKLLNDLESMAYGMLYLPETDLISLNPDAGPRKKGNVAVLAAGTGLGEAFLFWDGNRYHTIATEGGHTDFAPQDVIENHLLRFLIDRFGTHVSYERSLSGPGIYNVYSFLVERNGTGPHPKVAEALARDEDPSAVVSELGLANADPTSRETLELFCRIYGAEAGNMALKILAVGGVMIGGGIAPKILPVLQNGLFLQGFLRKGRFATFMKSLPLFLTTNPRVAIIGAAEYALGMVAH